MEFEPKVRVIIPAGGQGVRFGGGVKKQFLLLDGDSVLNRTIKIFLSIPEVCRMVVALPEDEIDAQSGAFSHDKVTYVKGGGCRAMSVHNAFMALGDCRDADLVLVHDAVRPLASEALIRRVIVCAALNGTALPVAPVTDTIKMIEKDLVTATVDRAKLGAAQTPQGARYGVFREAYAAVGEALSAMTDEAMLWESVGLPVYTVAGDRENIKVTTAFDLKVAEAVLQAGGRI